MSKPPVTARDRLAMAARLRRGEVTVNGETFTVRGLTSRERAVVLGQIRDAVAADGLPNYAPPAAFGLCSDDGSPMFLGETAEADALAFVESLDGVMVETIGQKVMELAGLRSGEAGLKN